MSTPAFAAVAWSLFVVAVLLVRRLPVRPAVALILAGGIIAPVAAVLAPPGTSDDVYRYVWDGRVQAAGIDPYAHPPAATALDGLRDPPLWTSDGPWCVGPDERSAAGESLTAGCTLINRPSVPTIYPPAAQLYFAGAASVASALPTPRRPSLPFQVGGALFAMATTVLLLLAARARGADPRTVVLWAWCPAVYIEGVNNAHVDVVAAFLTGAALLLRTHAVPGPGGRWPAIKAGALLGLAVATKPTPLLLLPSLVGRRLPALLLAMASAVGLLYLPHLLRVGIGVIGYLPGYLSEEGYTSGGRFALLTLLVPPAWAPAAAVVVMTGVSLWVLRRPCPDAPWRGGATMTGAALLVATPTYPWYALLLVLLVGLGASSVWLVVVAAGQVAQHAALSTGDGLAGQRWGYGVALAVVVLASIVRARPTDSLRIGSWRLTGSWRAGRRVRPTGSAPRRCRGRPNR